MRRTSSAALCFALLLLCGVSALYSQVPSLSTAITSVPSWFTRCAGENGQCVVTASAQVIYGSATGASPAAAGNFYSQTVTQNVLCSNSVFGDPDLGHAKACWYGPPPGLGQGRILDYGGSNYPFYVQNFESWDDNQRIVIGLYHLDPTIVQAQLRQMHKEGQRRVALVIWYMPFDSSTSPGGGIPTVWPDVFEAYVNSSGGSLSPQAQQNLTAILGLIKQIGFEQVTLRFAPVGSRANPVLWGNTWNEAGFQEDESFIFNTRQLTESALAGSAVSRAYDLGVELGGIPHLPNPTGDTYTDGQTPEWTSRLWTDYVRNFGKTDSYGFSIAYSFGSLAKVIAEYDRAGVRPDSYAVDSYVGTDLWYCYQELAAAQELAKPLILQETSYNDATQMALIQTELQHTPLTIAYIDQWPWSGSVANADASPPTNYGAYGGNSNPSGTIVVAPCTLQLGDTTCTTQASWSTSNSLNVSLYVNGIKLQNQSNITTDLTGTASLVLGLTPSTVLLVSDEGALSTQIEKTTNSAAAANQQLVLDTQTISAVDPYAPRIVVAGLGGTSNRAAWVVGENISSNCSVQLYDANFSSQAPVAVLSSLECQPDSLSFWLPTTVLTNYSSLYMTISNPGGHISAPYYFSIQPVPALSAAGVGGASNHAIWAVGSNISLNCKVQLYDAANPSSAALVVIDDVSCQTNSLSFLIPNAILGNYNLVQMIVVNDNGQMSSPLLVNLY